MIEQERAEAFIALGFSTTQALLLAATRDDGQHVEVDVLRRMLEAGCTHDVAVRIFL
jgi:hypothetical protein